MKYVFSLIFLTVISGFGFAQEGVIVIEKDPKIDQLLQAYNEVNKQDNYYQIQVGFGDLRKAEYLKAKVEVEFPGWYSKIDFKEPTYRVKLGRFRDLLEAERKFQEVRKKYPNAMLLKPENSSR